MKKRIVNGIAAFMFAASMAVIQIQAAQYSRTTDNPAAPQTGGFIAAVEAHEMDSIPISNREELERIADDPEYPLSGKYHLTNDIDLGGGEWTPIGDNSTNSDASRFTGVFDGQGYVIRNLTISEEHQYNGLFGYVQDAAIKNVGLEGARIQVSASSFIYTGGIAGYGTGAVSIENCYHEGRLSASMAVSSPSNDKIDAVCAGGIIGYINGKSGEYNKPLAVLNNCRNEGEIYSAASTSAEIVWNILNAGGICGYAEGSVSIEGCSNSGNVSGSVVDSYGGIAYSGGICGSSYGSRNVPVRNCYNTGNVSGTFSNSTNTSSNAGGICGESAGSVENCYNTGEIYAFNSAGGVCGTALGSGPIRNCYNTGAVSAAPSDFSDAGGICGYSYVSIVNCRNAGPVTVSSGYSNAGGICGVSAGSVFIQNSYNTGIITSAASINSCAGGIFGLGIGSNYGYDPGSDPDSAFRDDFLLENCYNTGDVLVSDIDFSAEGGSRSAAGGIFGRLGSYRSISISDCYSTGTLSGFMVGGIFGEISDNVRDITLSVSKCYWNIDCVQMVNGDSLADMDKKGVGFAPNGIDGTTPLATGQMKDHRNADQHYTGFDFDTVWGFQKDVNEGYPLLQTHIAVTVELNGEPIYFKDQQPVIQNGRTLVPVRGVFEHLGFSVAWDPAVGRITLKNGEYIIAIKVGESAFTVNDQAIDLDVPAQIINDRTMLPFRFLLESVGYSVEWDGERKIVMIYSPNSAD